MNIPVLTTGHLAEGTISARSIVARGTAENAATAAIAATDKLLGVSTIIDTDDGQHTDVIRLGFALVTYGATIAAGDYVTTDAQSRAVVAASGEEYIGIAEESGDVDEIGSIFVMPGRLP